MEEAKWQKVDRYIDDLFRDKDPALQEALKASEAAGLPPIAVSPAHGRFLTLVARMVGARRILELGTLGGYSTICLARALPPDGRLVTLEANPVHLEIAQGNLARAGLSEQVEIRLGPALETLPRLAQENAAPFDFIFIDADKENYVPYFEWALRLSRVGTVIVADNVVRKGEVIDAESEDSRVQGARRFNEVVSTSSGISATIIQTVGSKGYDGFLFALVDALPA